MTLRGIIEHEGRTINFFYDIEDIPPELRDGIGQIIADFKEGVFHEGFRRFFDRDPDRRIPSDTDIIVAPADGILIIHETPGHYHLRIAMRYSDVHVQRIHLPG
ncbi:MAG: hypothetical protein AAB036_05350, partial [Elusimicrobiota bacterium]